MSACDKCLRRGRTLELLAGHLETERARIDELLACPDEALVEAVAGDRAGELRRALERFDADAQRARVRSPSGRAVVGGAGIDVVCRCSADYPSQLLELRAPPAALYMAGPPRRLAWLAAEPAVAIVGARRATAYGIETARSLGSELAGAGVTVVSGMALGIDGAAHAGALEGAGGGPATAGGGPATAGGDPAGCARSRCSRAAPIGRIRPATVASTRGSAGAVSSCPSCRPASGPGAGCSQPATGSSRG